MTSSLIGWKHKPLLGPVDCIGPEPRILPDCTCEDEEFIMLHSWCRKIECTCELHKIYVNM